MRVTCKGACGNFYPGGGRRGKRGSTDCMQGESLGLICKGTSNSFYPACPKMGRQRCL